MVTNQARKTGFEIAQPSESEVRSYLGHLLGQAEFNASERNKRFLSYIIEETLGGRGHRIKAYTIALAAFDREQDFDPLVDPIVRIEASRLRRSLEHYYLTAGKADRIRISIPKGAYIATFAYRDAADLESEAGAEPPVPWASALPAPVASRNRHWGRLALAVGLFIIVAATMIAYRPWSIGDHAAAEGSEELSISVLPFENTSGDPDRAFVARALTYDLIVKLSQLDGATIFSLDGAFLGSPENQAPARSNYTLFGSVQSEAHRLRVTAILADARNGQFLGSWNFEREVERLDYAGLQSDIAAQVVLGLRRLCATDVPSSQVGSTDPLGKTTSYNCRRLIYLAAK